MSRGLPAFWSIIAAFPFIGGGYLLYSSTGPYPQNVGFVFILLGLFILVLGLYVHFVAAPSRPSFGSDEETLRDFPPTQRVAKMKVIISIPLLIGGIYMLHFTLRPYIQPILMLGAGWYLSMSGIYTYWRNSLTTYYITDQRVIRSYRFLSSATKQVPFDMVRGISKGRSVSEMLLGLGNVTVATGSGAGLTVRLRNIERPDDIEDIIRREANKYRNKIYR